MYNDRIVLYIPGNILSYLKTTMYPSMNIIKLNVQGFFPWNLFLLSFANNFNCDKFSEENFFVLVSFTTFAGSVCDWRWAKNAWTLLCWILSLWRREVDTSLCENLAFTFLNAGLVANKVGPGSILLSVAWLLYTLCPRIKWWQWHCLSDARVFTVSWLLF